MNTSVFLILLVVSLASPVASRIAEPLCSQDVQECEDGSFVSRDPKNKCQFAECPVIVIDCAQDVQECKDGSFVSRDPKNKCKFAECPDVAMCAQDVKKCKDGSFVSRDPKNKCQFAKCPLIVIDCAQDVQECKDGSFVSRDPENKCQFAECPDAIVCTEDVFECDDGSILSRDPNNECEFPACPAECYYQVNDEVDCATAGYEEIMDTNQCEDAANALGIQYPNGIEVNPWSTGTRKAAHMGCVLWDGYLTIETDTTLTNTNSCNWGIAGNPGLAPCICKSTCVACPKDLKECEDRSTVGRDPANGCEFHKCPTVVISCGQDVLQCEDGSTVSRDPENNCEFPECPVVGCPRDIKQCEDGSEVIRDPANGCEFHKCPTVVISCGQDVLQCEDGSTVSRDPENNCEFPKCPPTKNDPCPGDVRDCDDGSTVIRDPKNNCEFPSCPIRHCEGDIKLVAHDGETMCGDNMISIISQDSTSVTVRGTQTCTDSRTTIDHVFWQYKRSLFNEPCFEEDNVEGGKSTEFTIECSRTNPHAMLEVWVADDINNGLLSEGDDAEIPECCHPDLPTGTPAIRYVFMIKCESSC